MLANRQVIGWVVLALAGVLAAPHAAAQQFEIGALGMITTYKSVGVSGAGSSGSVGPGFGPAGGFFVSQTLSGRWGGELRYIYFQNGLNLESSGTEASFGARSHAVHYDLVYNLSDEDARYRPYVAAGFGLKYYQGTGTEDPFQPLSHLALLTKTSQALPAGDFGAGVKFRVGNRATIRVEFRDYISAVPDRVIAGAPGSKVSGILHHWAPMFGISWVF